MRAGILPRLEVVRKAQVRVRDLRAWFVVTFVVCRNGVGWYYIIR